MEKIIKGKIYNTEKAELITNCGIHNLELNLDELTEILYKTKNGEYFLYSYVCNIINGENKLGEYNGPRKLDNKNKKNKLIKK